MDTKETIYNEFCETIEKDAIGLHDDFFVRLTPDALNMISECQHESDPDTYQSKWEKKIGEKVFLYDDSKEELKFYIPVGLGDLSYCKKEDNDLRLAEKESLTKTAARKFAQYLYNGKYQIDDIGDHCSIAMMLYLRNGFDKEDFWKAFRVELANGLKELLEGKESLDIEEVISQDVYTEEDGFIVDIVKIAEEGSEEYPETAFHLLNEELSDILIKNSDLTNDEIKKSLGEYVAVWSIDNDTDDSEGYLTIEEMRNGEHDLLYDNMVLMPFMAAISFEDEFFMNSCDTSSFIHDLSMGIALYKKNGRTSADFWRDFCDELLKLLERKS